MRLFNLFLALYNKDDRNYFICPSLFLISFGLVKYSILYCFSVICTLIPLAIAQRLQYALLFTTCHINEVKPFSCHPPVLWAIMF